MKWGASAGTQGTVPCVRIRQSKTQRTVPCAIQIIDDIRIPYGSWNQADYLEPITRDFPQFGPGGATQAITDSAIKLDEITDLLN